MSTYQSIYYDHINNKIYLREDDSSEIYSFNYTPTVYKVSNDGDFVTIDGKKVTPINFPKYSMLKNLPADIYYEKDVSPVMATLVNKYLDNESAPSYHNILYLDIEIEISGTLDSTLIENAPNKITSISLYDNTTKKYYCLLLNEKNNDIKSVEGVELILFNNEKDLLLKLISLFKELDPTILIGWNSQFFDIPYIYYRTKRILGENNANRYSPIGIVNKTKMFDHDLGIEVSIIDFAMINHLDYMLLWKKYNDKKEETYKLDKIGLKYINLGKIEYNGNLDTLFKEDINKFIEYNIRDVEIIVKLDNLKKYIDITVAICHISRVSYNNIYYATATAEGAVMVELKKQGIISPNKPTTYNKNLKTLPYPGGYLKTPEPGVYSWICDLDFTSLYPSIIRSLNIGLETLLGRISGLELYDCNCGLNNLKEMDPEKELEIEIVNSNRVIENGFKIKVKDLIRNIEKKKYTISANGTIYTTSKTSVVVDIMNKWFKLRKDYQKQKKDAHKNGDKKMTEFYDQRQFALKKLLNAFYGTYARVGSRYTDGNFFISKSITLTGQRLTKDSIDWANKFINTEIGTNKDYIVTSDTDSMFIKLDDLIKFRNKNIPDDENVYIEKALEITKDIQEKTIPFLNQLSKDVFNVENKYFELKQEVIIKAGYYDAKRRYAMRVINDNGMKVNKLVIMGLNIMQSSFNKLFKDVSYKVIDFILDNKSKKEIDKLLLDFYYNTKNINFTELLTPTGFRKLDEYIDDNEKYKELNTTVIKKGCPINTRSVIKYNDLLEHLGLNNKYSGIVLGESIKFCYLKKNPLNIDVVAYKEDGPDEIKNYISKYIDREKMFNNIFVNKIDKIYKNLKWQLPQFSDVIQLSLFD